MSGCEYCQKGRKFLAFGTSDDSLGCAHIEIGTNIFVDSAGRHMRFQYCPQCGKPLLDTPNAGGVKPWPFLFLLPVRPKKTAVA